MRQLTLQEKAAMPDCLCPLPHTMVRPKPSKKTYIVPIVIFLLFVYIVWALWPLGALWLIGIYGVLALGGMVWRALKGHSIKCILVWGPVGALYTIGEAVLTGI
ncbi:MAG TPA: hypothetical protein VFT87_01810 [Candidatus Saccharimonadales bacterium]|nr:hypothetical protein [Candidatus Saccharimonadales bacterium]